MYALHLIAQWILKATGAVWRRFLVPFAPWILVAVLGAVAWTWAPVIGPRAQLQRSEAQRSMLQTAADNWKGNALGWMISFSVSESNRLDETRNARAAIDYANGSCLTQIEEARRSSSVIERIITKEPVYVQSDPLCPAAVQRELVDPDQLRQAIAPGR